MSSSSCRATRREQDLMSCCRSAHLFSSDAVLDIKHNGAVHMLRCSPGHQAQGAVHMLRICLQRTWLSPWAVSCWIIVCRPVATALPFRRFLACRAAQARPKQAAPAAPAAGRTARMGLSSAAASVAAARAVSDRPVLPAVTARANTRS